MKKKKVEEDQEDKKENMPANNGKSKYEIKEDKKK